MTLRAMNYVPSLGLEAFRIFASFEWLRNANQLISTVHLAGQSACYLLAHSVSALCRLSFSVRHTCLRNSPSVTGAIPSLYGVCFDELLPHLISSSSARRARKGIAPNHHGALHEFASWIFFFLESLAQQMLDDNNAVPPLARLECFWLVARDRNSANRRSIMLSCRL